MSDQISLKAVERKAWSSAFLDGLWDLYFGMLMLSSAVGEYLSRAGAPDGVRIPSYVSIMVLGGVMLWAGKRFVTRPRMGRFKPGPARQARVRRLYVVIGVAVLATWVIFMTGLAAERGWFERPAWWQAGGPFSVSAVIVAVLLVAFGSMAYYFEYRRLYLYAALIALPEVGGVILQETAGIEWGFFALSLASAITILAMGGALFVRFVRAYPPLPRDEHLPEGALNG